LISRADYQIGGGVALGFRTQGLHPLSAFSGQKTGAFFVQDNQRFAKGLEIRREVLGNEYVDNNLAGSDDFMMTFQRIVTELAWGYAWNGTALDRKTKSMLSIAILAASGRFEEVEIYTRGALRTGVTLDELKEILTHVAVYCGTPTGRQSFLAARKALQTAEGSK
jgi:4-carboxymuconolactone decarboxylase